MRIFWLFFWRFYRAACRRACSAAPGSSPCWWRRRTANWEPGTAETTSLAGGWGRISGSEEREKKTGKRIISKKNPHGSGPIISVGRLKHLRTGYSFPWLHIPGAFTTAIYAPSQGYWISIHSGGCGWYSGARDGGILKDTWFGTRL